MTQPTAEVQVWLSANAGEPLNPATAAETAPEARQAIAISTTRV